MDNCLSSGKGAVRLEIEILIGGRQEVVLGRC